MQNMRTRLFMKKHGPALVFSLCLVGAAAFTTVYTLDQAESTKEQEEQTTELEPSLIHIFQTAVPGKIHL